MKRKIDEKRPYAEVVGSDTHRYEQDGLRYNAHKECIDKVPKNFVEVPESEKEAPPVSTVIGTPDPGEEDEPDDELVTLFEDEDEDEDEDEEDED